MGLAAWGATATASSLGMPTPTRGPTSLPPQLARPTRPPCARPFSPSSSCKFKPPGASRLEIGDIRGEEDWAVINAQPQAPDDGRPLSTEGTILIAYRAGDGDRDGGWKVAYPGTLEFNEQLERLPQRYYSEELKDFFRSPAILQDSSSIYNSPMLAAWKPW